MTTRKSKRPAVGSARRPAPVAEAIERRLYLAATVEAAPLVVLASNLATPQGYSSPSGAPLTPAKMRSAYGLGPVGNSNVTFGGIQGDGAGQTIAIVGSGDYPTAASDLAAFDAYWGLPAPPSFQKLNASGAASPLPATGNAGEAALDVEWAHVMAPGASIILFEGSLYTAMTTAKNTPGVSVVSVSYNISGNQADSFYDTPAGHTGVTFLGASGDSPTDVAEPGQSVSVVSVGGTALTLSGSNYGSETTWSSAGGGLATDEPQPAYQAVKAAPYSTQYRATPDVSMDAAPSTGVAVYNTTSNAAATPWSAIIGGTSLSTPLWAGLIAVVDQGRVDAGLTSMDGYTQTLPRLYTLPSADFHDITTGAAGNPAEPGYDLATGLGTPIASRLLADLAGADTVSGRAFADANDDGTFDGLDQALAGATVYLDTNDDGVLDAGEPTTTTAANGIYTFTDVLGGLTGAVRLTSSPVGYPAASTATTFATSYDATQTVDLGFHANASATAPTVVTPATATPNPTSTTTTNLSVLGTNGEGESSLTYAWAATATPAGAAAPTFSVNGTNGAKSTTATFTRAGTYGFSVTLTDAAGLTTTSGVTVTVAQALTALALSPPDPNLTAGQTQQFSAVQNDQFGNAMASPVAVTWLLLSGGGTMATSGLYTTPGTGTLALVQATAGSVAATEDVYVVSSPWTSADVGAPALAGSAYDASGTFALAGGGGDVIGSDQLHYVYQTLAGDGTIVARVASLQDTAATALAGVMIRASLAAGSVQATMAMTATQGPEFVYRTTTDGGTTGFLPNPSYAAPYYVKLVRAGDLFTGYDSSDGTTWHAVGSATVAMTGTVYVGLMDTSGTASALDTATLDHVVIGPTVARAADATPNPVTGTTAALSVLGADDNGEPTLTYTWSATAAPSGAATPTFSVNGTNGAKGTTATFHQAGAYVFAVTIADASGSTVTSSVAVTVTQTLTAVVVSPASATLVAGAKQQFTAVAYDQFGIALAAQPTFAWTVAAGAGTISSAGLYTAGASGTATVRATAGTVSGTATATTAANTISGTSGNDVIRLVRSGANLLVYVNNAAAPLYTLAYASLGALALNTGAGTDAVNVDFSGGATPVPAGGLTVAGGGGADALTVTGTTAADAVAVGGTAVAVNGSSFAYSGMTAIVVNGDGGADALTQAAQPGGPATLAFNGTTGGGPSSADTLSVNGGTYTFAAPAAGSGQGAISLFGLTVAAGATVAVKTAAAATDRWALVVSSLADAGRLDLGGNDLIVHNGGLSALTALLKSGDASGAWTGTGIDSSAAAGDASHHTALAIAPNVNVAGTALYTTFDKQAVVATDVLIRSTLYGDANLDGVVNIADYTRVDVGFISAGKLTGWANGDFNYDGAIDGNDYALIDSAFAAPAAVATAAVEPVSPMVVAQAVTKPSASAASNRVVAAAFRPASPFAASPPISAPPSSASDVVDELRKHARRSLA